MTSTLDYAYDLAGRLIQVKTDGVETESYQFDKLVKQGKQVKQGGQKNLKQFKGLREKVPKKNLH